MYTYNLDVSTNERIVFCKKAHIDVSKTDRITLPPAPKEEEELIDESTLLANDTRGDVNSCGVDAVNDGVPGKKRACKNCSCGKQTVV